MSNEIIYGLENLIYYQMEFSNKLNKVVEERKEVPFKKIMAVLDEILWIQSQICYALDSRDTKDAERLDNSMDQLQKSVARLFEDGIVVYGDAIDEDA